MGRDSPGGSLEGELASGFHLDALLGSAEHSLRDEDLARGGLAAGAGGQVGHGADGGVVAATPEADGADRCVTLGDADAEIEAEAELAPLLDMLGDLICSATQFLMVTAIRSARSTGFGMGTGSLKKIIMPSPVKRSSVPSCSRISLPMAA